MATLVFDGITTVAASSPLCTNAWPAFGVSSQLAKGKASQALGRLSSQPSGSHSRYRIMARHTPVARTKTLLGLSSGRKSRMPDL